jgi:hypothetical protein
MGLFHPLAQVKGFSGCSFTASTCNNLEATAFSFVMQQRYGINKCIFEPL